MVPLAVLELQTGEVIMVFAFLFQSAIFQAFSILYWLLAIYGWVEIAAEGELTASAFRQSLWLTAKLYVGATLCAALMLEAVV